MQTVVETPPYLSDAHAAGVSENERGQIVDLVAERPDSGDLIKGAGGARKFRFARRGGKSGGYRVITFYADETIPVFLLALFAKGDRANLSKSECNAIATLTKRLLKAEETTNDRGAAMTKKVFDRIAAGLEAAIDYAEGRANLSDYRIHVPPVDVSALRDRLRLSQTEFASRFGFAIDDVRAWEGGARPEGALRAYLLVIERDPDAVSRALREQTAA